VEFKLILNFLGFTSLLPYSVIESNIFRWNCVTDLNKCAPFNRANECFYLALYAQDGVGGTGYGPVCLSWRTFKENL